MKCISYSGNDQDIYFDPELHTCVNKDREFDYPVNQINSDAFGSASNVGYQMLKRDFYITWDNNVAPEIKNQYEMTADQATPTIKYGNSVFVAIPTTNTCYEVHCPLTAY